MELGTAATRADPEKASVGLKKLQGYCAETKVAVVEVGSTAVFVVLVLSVILHEILRVLDYFHWRR